MVNQTISLPLSSGFVDEMFWQDTQFPCDFIMPGLHKAKHVYKTFSLCFVSFASFAAFFSFQFSVLLSLYGFIKINIAIFKKATVSCAVCVSCLQPHSNQPTSHIVGWSTRASFTQFFRYVYVITCHVCCSDLWGGVYHRYLSALGRWGLVMAGRYLCTDWDR